MSSCRSACDSRASVRPRSRCGAAGAARALGAGSAPAREDALAPLAREARSAPGAAHGRAHDARPSPARRPTTGSFASAGASRSPRRTRASASTGRMCSVVPARPGIQLDGVGAARALLHAALKRRPQLRVAQLPVQEAPAKLSTQAARAMHISGIVSTYTTVFGGVPNRIHNVELVVAPRRQQADRPGRDVLVQQDDRRAERLEGLSRRARDRERRADDRSRRRRLPGLDHRLQRRVRSRAEDHRAHEPRALHQPLPAGTRRDRELPGRRPRVRERHGELDAAPHVRQLVVAHREALRDAGGPQGHEHGHSARRARQAAGEEDDRSHAQAGREDRRRPGLAGALDERHPRRLRRGRQAALPRHVVLVLPRPAEARAARACEEEAEEGEARTTTTTTTTTTQTTTTQSG